MLENWSKFKTIIGKNRIFDISEKSAEEGGSNFTRARVKRKNSFSEESSSTLTIKTNTSRSKVSYSSKNKRKMEFYKLLQLSGIFMLLIFLNTCAWVAEKKSYGEECASADECNEREMLSCLNSRCNCYPSQSLLFSQELSQCVARVGEKCGSGVRTELLSIPVSCVEGALCDESSWGCVCTDDFFRLTNGTCARKRKYSEFCENDGECSKDIRSSKSLVCLNGACSCDSLFQFYDERRRHCVTKIGGECNYYRSSADGSKYYNECPENGQCIDGICTCGDGFAKTSSGTCALGYNSSCKGERECADLSYQCLDGLCKCKYPLHQLYDSKSGECLSLVGGPCSLPQSISQTKENSSSLLLRCTKNAICTDQGFYNSCECMEGYVQRLNGECAPGFGESCEPHECDPITPLYCKNMRCECQDELLFYDKGRKRCLGLIGSRCNPLEINQCVQFASCIQVGSETEGKCLCDRYSQEVENRTCIYNEA